MFAPVIEYTTETHTDVHTDVHTAARTVADLLAPAVESRVRHSELMAARGVHYLGMITHVENDRLVLLDVLLSDNRELQTLLIPAATVCAAHADPCAAQELITSLLGSLTAIGALY